MNNKLFTSLNDVLRDEFGSKVIKLSLDGGFTCPNRDGKLSYAGCIFCSSSGSGDFTADKNLSIDEQIMSQINLLSQKWNNAKYIAYFQNFTNTYAPVEYLENLYYQALNNEYISGIAIATRPDCINEQTLKLLDKINKETFLWVELGLQTIHKKTSDFINRQYDLEVYDDIMKKLNKLSIKTVTHIIVNLPNESDEDILKSVEYVCKSGIWGIKLQMLNVLKNTKLEKIYTKEKFYLKSADEYIEFISNAITYIPKNIVIHRLTGDGDKNILIEPKWVQNKRYVLNGIQKYMRENNLYQGKYNKSP